jgi:hypothetical protein
MMKWLAGIAIAFAATGFAPSTRTTTSSDRGVVIEDSLAARTAAEWNKLLRGAGKRDGTRFPVTTSAYCDDLGRDCTMNCMRSICGGLDPGDCLGLCVSLCCGFNIP